MRLGMAQHRHHQAAVGLRGHAGCTASWRVTTPASSSKRALICGKSRSASTMARARKGSSVSLLRAWRRGLVELLAQLLQLGHVTLFHIAEVRDAALGLLHLLAILRRRPMTGIWLLAVALHMGEAPPRRLAAGQGKGVQVRMRAECARPAAAMPVAQLHARSSARRRTAAARPAGARPSARHHGGAGGAGPRGRRIYRQRGGSPGRLGCY